MLITINYQTVCCPKNFISKGQNGEEHYHFFQNSKHYFLKLYKGTSEKYRFGYEQEYLRMTQSNIANSEFFPRYYQVKFTNSQIHYLAICTDYIEGQTLEYYLKSHPLFWTTKQYKYLLEQLNIILNLLFANNILYLDLKPANIIIINNQLDIKLIDHTFCMYIDIPFAIEPQIRRSCNYIEINLPPEDLLIQVVAYFHAACIYGGDYKKMQGLSHNTLKRIYRETLHLTYLEVNQKLEHLIGIYPPDGDPAFITYPIYKQQFFEYFSHQFNCYFEYLLSVH